MHYKTRLFENILSLYALQGVNYILPLLTMPYLVRIIGPGKFGLIAFAMAFTQYFLVITDYGFNLSATRQISKKRDDPGEVSKIFIAVMFIKFILMILCFVIACVIVISFQKFRNDWNIYLISFLSLLGNLLFPVWFFQGIEKIKFIAVLNFIAKVLTTAAIFIFIRKPSDYSIALLIQVSGVILSGVVGIITVFIIYPIEYIKPNVALLKTTLIDGWSIFLSQVSVTLFSNTGIFILGLNANSQTVGYYAIADKLVKAVIGLVAPVCNSIYPRVCALFSDSSEKAVAFLRKILLFGGIIFAVVSGTLFMSSDILIRLVTGSPNQFASLLIKIMSILPFTVFVDNIYGTQILLNINKDREFLYAIVRTGLFSLGCSLIFVPIFGAIASATIFSLSGILIMTLMSLPVMRENIRLLTRYF